jgi:hypothetical protein
MAADREFWHSWRGTLPSSPRGSTVVSHEDPMRRLRGHTGSRPGWGRHRSEVEAWVSEARGPLICSRMAYRSGDQHAPVFDVDLPVVAVRQAGGGSGVVLTGLLGPTRLRRLGQGLAFLRRHGFVRDEDAQVVRGQLRAAMESDMGGRLVLPLSCPARTVPSANPDHRHLYVDMVMPFAESVRLARALGFVDPDHIARSRRMGQWQVRLAWKPPSTPPPPQPVADAGRAAPAESAPPVTRVPLPREGYEPVAEATVAPPLEEVRRS